MFRKKKWDNGDVFNCPSLKGGKLMAKMIQCPNCGSERISVNGVLQRKKGLLYYLSGQVFSDAGKKSGFKTSSKLFGNKLNAECHSCGHKWHQG